MRAPRRTSRRSLRKHDLLRESFGRDLAVALLDLDSDGATAEVLRGAERRPAPHERINDYAAGRARVVRDEADQLQRFLRRVIGRAVLIGAPDDRAHEPQAVVHVGPASDGPAVWRGPSCPDALDA